MTIIDYKYGNLTMIISFGPLGELDQFGKKNSIVCTLHYVNDTYNKCRCVLF